MIKCNRLKSWRGGLGNNLIQLANALHYCKLHHQTLIYRNHKFLPTRIFSFGKNQNNLQTWYANAAWDLEQTFKDYHLDRYKIFQECIYYLLKNNDSCPFMLNDDSDIMKLITPITKKKSKAKNNQKNKKLLIYVRSGDIMKTSCLAVNTEYVQSPNSYIEYVIKKEKPKKIVLLYQDEVNPIVPFIKSKFGHLIDNKNSGTKDLQTLINLFLKSEIIVQTGLTTLASTLSLSSHNLKKIYIPAYEAIDSKKNKTAYKIMFSRYNPKVNVIRVKHNNYIKVGEWRGKVNKSCKF